ncbi:MAG: hypothetical protein HYU66_21765, partial [Armatimonadetes bacterium]|nr:hypothetical protein [Armatimonadota bacterium]
MSHHRCLVLLLLPLAALAEDAFVDDGSDPGAWSKRPDWLGAPAERPTVESRDGVLTFSVDQPNHGMKWTRDLGVDDVDMFPWLVVRYRATGVDVTHVDYVLYVGDSKKGREGLRLLSGERVKVDGQWHTMAFNLSDEGAVPPLHTLAVGCYAGAGGQAKVEFSGIAVTETPPADAEGLQPAGPPGRDFAVPVDDPAAWSIQPSWLGNYGEDSRLEKTAAGVRFVVPTPGTGAKWSRGLAEPLGGVGWVSLRYRANGCAAGGDYALYLAISPGGQALEEQFAVTRDQIVSDGRWQVAIARVSVSAVQTIAVQVQAAAPNASLELSRLTFHETRPPVTAEDLLPPDDGYQGLQRSGQPVALPPGNLDGAGLARLMGGSGWTARGTVTVGGVPFALREGADLVRMTAVRELGSIEVPLRGRGTELYLLLAAKLPSPDEPSYGGQTTRTVRHVDRFVARVEYAVLLDPGRELKRLVLRDGMRRGAFGLLAATLGDKATLPAEPTAPLVVPPPRKAASVRTGITQAAGHVVITSGTVRLDLDTSKGLRLAAARNLTFNGAPLQVTPGPLFHLQAGERRVSSEEFATIAVRVTGDTAEIELGHAGFDPPLAVTVTADLSEPGEIGLRAKLAGGGLTHTATHLFFPELNGVAFGSAQDAWYFIPRRGAVINRLPIRLREAYCGEMPMQVIDAFDPGRGAGLYLMTQDMDAVPRYYLVEKNATGVRLAVEYHPIAAGETPRTVLGCHQGDWHAALDRYQRWAATWYKPAAPRKDWFRRVFSFRQQFINFAFPAPTGYFDGESKTFHFAEALKRDEDAFGGVDYLHLFDWGWDPVHGRCGDYAPWDHLGGADNLRRAVEQTRAAGTPVGLYIEGYLVDQESELGKAKGKDWELRDAEGKPYPYFAPCFNMCPAASAWQ